MKKLSVSVFALMSSTLTWSGIYEDFKNAYPTYSEEKQQSIRKNIKDLDWTPIVQNQQKSKTMYLNYDYVKSIDSSTVEVWEKRIVNIDLDKDSLLVNDYQMVKGIYYCDKMKYRILSVSSYKHKTGKSFDSFNYEDMNKESDIFPDSVGDELMQFACVMNLLKTY
ncbi:surface-adhesin E family protein [Acinetobacter pittii]|uniref:surface-adhesin E family protein n=1 Tax=Acinetobacter pittii TaxID=48296 RepID=UPI00355C8BB3